LEPVAQSVTGSVCDPSPLVGACICAWWNGAARHAENGDPDRPGTYLPNRLGPPRM